MNRPWMPLYVADYLADTAHLNAAQSGAYLHLIMHYWMNGGLPDDNRQLSLIARMTTAEWRKARPIIQQFFSDGWKHKRIEFELTEAARISAAGRAGGEASGRIRRERSAQRSANDPPTIDERSFNDPPTNCEALPSPSQPQSQIESSSLRSEENARARASPSKFDHFWRAYPHKVGKREAAKAFDRVGKSGAVTFDELMAALTAYANKTDDRPWCNPATWLNQGRWDDQPAPEVPRNGQGKSALAAADRLIEQFGGREAAAAYVPGSEGPKPLSLDLGPSPPRPKRISSG